MDNDSVAPTAQAASFFLPLQELLTELYSYNEKFGGVLQIPIIVISGIQSSGKTSWLEAMVGFPAGYKGRKTSTRRARQISLRHNKDCTEPVVTFAGEKINWKKLPDYNEKVDAELERENRFSSEVLYITIESAHVIDCDFVDLIGLRTNPEGPVEEAASQEISRIAATHMRKPGAVNVSILKCTEDAETLMDLSFLEELAVSGKYNSCGAPRKDFVQSGLFVVNRINEKMNFKDTQDANDFFASALKRKSYHFVSLVPGLSLVDPDAASFDDRVKFLQGLRDEEKKLYSQVKDRLVECDKEKGKAHLCWNEANDSILGIDGAMSKMAQKLQAAVQHSLPAMKQSIQQQIQLSQQDLNDLRELSIFNEDRFFELKTKVLDKYTEAFLTTLEDFQEGRSTVLQRGELQFKPDEHGGDFLEELKELYCGTLDIEEMITAVQEKNKSVMDLDKKLTPHGSVVRALKVFHLELLEMIDTVGDMTDDEILALAYDPRCGINDIFPADKVVWDMVQLKKDELSDSVTRWVIPFLSSTFCRHTPVVHEFLSNTDYPLMKHVTFFKKRLSDAYAKHAGTLLNAVQKNFHVTAQSLATARMHVNMFSSTQALTLPAASKMGIGGSPGPSAVAKEIVGVVSKATAKGLSNVDLVEDICLRVAPQRYGSVDFGHLRECARLQLRSALSVLMPQFKAIVQHEFCSLLSSVDTTDIRNMLVESVDDVTWETLQQNMELDLATLPSRIAEAEEKLTALRDIQSRDWKGLLEQAAKHSA